MSAIERLRENYIFDLVVRRRFGTRAIEVATDVERVRLDRLDRVLHAWVDGMAPRATPHERMGLLLGVAARLMAMPEAMALPEYQSSFMYKFDNTVADHAEGKCLPDVLDQLAKDCVTLSSRIVTARR
ncbi:MULTISPECIES: hypothetical protein [Burkholderia]|uniref:hypothetical protein n=1 Tax=Burkholderia TaxID=32008 RepID=UPI00163FB82C|nr:MULTISPECIES: hypothetical protein [Burkholderia]UVS94941.1 hypothetical protein EFP19_03535 [Burkholderia glumae]